MIISREGIKGLDGGDNAVKVATNFGRAIVRNCSERRIAPPTVVLGRDPCPSSMALSIAIQEGVESEGGRVERLGILPSYLVRREATRRSAYAGVCVTGGDVGPFESGIVVSLCDREIGALEMYRLISFYPKRVKRTYSSLPTSNERRNRRLAIKSYFDYIKGKYHGALAGAKISVDAAYGSMSLIAPKILESLGATVTRCRCHYDTDLVGCGSGVEDQRRLLYMTRDGDTAICFDKDGSRVAMAKGSRTVTNYGVDHLLKKTENVKLMEFNIYDTLEKAILFAHYEMFE